MVSNKAGWIWVKNDLKNWQNPEECVNFYRNTHLCFNSLKMSVGTYTNLQKIKLF